MKKITVFQLIIACVFLFTALSARAEDNIRSASDKYQETFKNEYDMKNRTGTLDYVTPTQEGSKYDHGTVEVAPPREKRPEGGMCSEDYVCRSLNEGSDTTCVYSPEFRHDRGSKDCRKMTEFCRRVFNDYEGNPPKDGLYAVACVR